MSTLAASRAAASPAPRGQLAPAWPIAIYLLMAVTVGAILLEWATRPHEEGQLRDWSAPLWTILVGIVCNASCAMLGCYLVLRRMSLLGDAISHAVLPGIALGYLFSGSVAGLPILLGAIVLGMLTSLFTQAISSLGRVSEDSSLGVVFTSLFALGVIMIQAFARNVDLDADCVLYGQIDFAGVDLISFFGYEISRPLLMLVPALAITVALITIFWKELKIAAFDPALTTAMGFRTQLIHYLLMAMVSGVTVASFESVGSILVVAMLIVPAATALQLTDRLNWMMAWAVAIGATSALYGYLLAVPLATSVSGAMAVVAGIQFAIAVFFAPRQGILSRWLRNKSLAVRIAAEDVLARLYRTEESGPASRSPPSASAGPQPASGGPPSASGGRKPTEAGPRGFINWLAYLQLTRRGLISSGAANAIALTDTGRAAARNLVRAHRLWESYLDTHFDLPRDHLHDAAERMEHYLDPQLTEDIAAELADRAVDPHGKVIPPS